MRRLRGSDVWVRTREDGALDVDADGRVEIRYKPDPAARVYRAYAQNLEDVPAAAPGAPAVARPLPARAAAAPRRSRTVPASEVQNHVFTDGACTGNPGPMGLGVVCLARGTRREISEYLGLGTNNIAELTAILRALDLLDELAVPAEDPVAIYTDSAYSIGVLVGGFKAKKNVELVGELRERLARRPGVEMVKVAGHAGVPENERADELARGGVKAGRRR